MARGVLLLLLAALLACGTRAAEVEERVAEVSAPRRFEHTRAAIATQAEQLVQEGKVLALGVVLVEGDRIAWSAGFGEARPGAAATPDTVFRVGSLAKPLLAAAVLQEVEVGAWQLDDPLREYLPERAEGAGAGVTLRHVLTHRSGLPADDLSLAWAGPDADWRGVAERVFDEPPALAPGRVLVYSNVAFAALGRALELEAGSRFEEHMRAGLLGPLGMSSAGFGRPGGPHAVPIGEELDAGLVPAAGLYASASDLGRFLAMILGGGSLGGGRVLEAASVAEMIRVQNAEPSLDLRTRVGLGWQRDPSALAAWSPVLWQDGQVPGHRAVMVALPRHGLGAVVLATTVAEPELVNALAFELIERAAKEAGKSPGTPSTRAGPRLAPLVDPTGSYQMQSGVLRVERDGVDLRVAPAHALAPQLPMPPGDEGRLVHVRDQTYRRESDGLLVHFARLDGEDVVVGERDGQRGRLGERIPARAIPPAWRARVGTWVPVRAGWYGLESVQLRAEHGQLTMAHDSTWDGEHLELALVPLDDERARVAGIGRGKGELVVVRGEAGASILRWQGLDMRLAGD